MQAWFKKRSNEASTWGGMGMAVLALGQAFKFDEAPAVAEAVGTVGSAVMGGVPWWQAALLGVGGLAMVLKSDGDKGW